MGLLQAFRMALKSLSSNKVRTFLTMLGIIIGVSTFIVLVALGEGNKKAMTDRLQSMGTNLIGINVAGRNSNRNVTLESLEVLRDKNADVIEAVAPLINGNVKVRYGNKSWDTGVNGTNAEYEQVRNLHVQSGRFLSSLDVEFRQRVVILGTAVVRNLFPAGVDPLGESIKINGEIYKVIGVLEEKQGGGDRTQDDKIVIPITNAQRLLKNAMIRDFYVQAKSPETVTDAMFKIQEHLMKIYRDSRTFMVFNQQDMLATVSELSNQLTMFLAAIAVISLLVGGIGIMNIMLVSVTERTREIGIRKAIGAKRKNILTQFIIEAIVISCFGGVIGITLGVGGSIYVPKISPTFSSIISPMSIVTSFSVSSVIGVFFGLYPAYKASKLNPIEALRAD